MDAPLFIVMRMSSPGSLLDLCPENENEHVLGISEFSPQEVSLYLLLEAEPPSQVYPRLADSQLIDRCMTIFTTADYKDLYGCLLHSIS